MGAVDDALAAFDSDGHACVLVGSDPELSIPV